MKSKHKSFSIQESGLYIHPQFSHLGATPDGIISCQCCGEGVLEIKCPYCSRDDLLTDATSVRKDFCLQLTEDGDLRLSKTHMYYYQVQTQVYVDFPDLIVWTQNDVHIERLLPDDDFWRGISKKASDLFNCAIMPELVAKYYSRKVSNKYHQAETPSDNSIANHSHSTTHQDQATSRQVWCLCQDEEYGKMIACDSSDCPLVWFHYTCWHQAETKSNVALPSVQANETA